MRRTHTWPGWRWRGRATSTPGARWTDSGGSAGTSSTGWRRRYAVETQTKVRKDFTIREKAPAWLRAPQVGAFSVIVKSSRTFIWSCSSSRQYEVVIVTIHSAEREEEPAALWAGGQHLRAVHRDNQDLHSGIIRRLLREYPVCGEKAVLTSWPAPERGQRGLRARARQLPPRGRGPAHLPASVWRGGGRGPGGGHRGHAGGRSLGQELLARLRVPATLTNRTLWQISKYLSTYLPINLHKLSVMFTLCVLCWIFSYVLLPGVVFPSTLFISRQWGMIAR